MGIYWRRSHQKNTGWDLLPIIWRKSFSQHPGSGWLLIRRTGDRGFVHTAQRYLVPAGCLSIHLDRYPSLTPDHRRRRSRMLAHRHQNYNHWHWSRVLFAYKSILSLYNCNRRARVYRSVLEMLVDCCFQETDAIRPHNHQRVRGWPWTHHRTSHETSAGGTCLPTCGGWRDDQKSVSGNGLGALGDIHLLLNVLEPCEHRHGTRFAWSAPPWSWMLRENSFALWYGERIRSFLCDRLQ